MLETVDRKPGNLYICTPICPNDLMGSIFTDQYSLPFGERLIHFYIVRNRTSIDIIGVQEGYIGGRQLNQLLHCIKPTDAMYNIDTADLLNDWAAIDWPANTERLAKHAAMHGWEAFYQDKEMLWKLIKEAAGDRNEIWYEEEPNQGVKGVIWWRLKPDDSRNMVLDKLVDHIKRPAFSYIVNAHRGPLEDPAILSTVVGTWILAYLSPEVREDKSVWKAFDSYGGECTGGFNMGTTQVGAMAIRYGDAFLNGGFRVQVEEYRLSTFR